MEIADIRREYTLGGLRRADLDANPIAQFQKWFGQAEAALAQKEIDVNAATLATADKSGKPSARIILLKGLDERGFIFFTNYNSRKGRELAENSNASLVFYWQQLERQVCVAGLIAKISREESEIISNHVRVAVNWRLGRLIKATLFQNALRWKRSGMKWKRNFRMKFHCRRIGAVTFCSRNGLNSGRAGRAVCTTAFATRVGRTVRGNSDGWRRDHFSGSISAADSSLSSPTTGAIA
jgi:hypothetical protein